MDFKAKAAAALENFNPRALVAPVVGTAAVLGTSLSTFAAEPTTLPTITVTTEMLEPLVQGVVSNLNVILPLGLGLMAILLGVKLIPRAFSWFTR